MIYSTRSMALRAPLSVHCLRLKQKLPQGTPERALFETEAEAFCLAETLREQRRLAGLTQQELADKIGTKKSYISKLENGHADVQLSTLFRIFAGLGKRISLTVL